MALIEINKNPSVKELRQFSGIWFPAFFLVIGLIAGLKFGLWSIVYPVWIVVAVIAIVGVIMPRWMKPLFVGWVTAAWPIGMVISHVILGVVWYLVLTPIGILVRKLSHDPMHRELKPDAATYWIPKTERRPAKSYFRQF